MVKPQRSALDDWKQVDLISVEHTASKEKNKRWRTRDRGDIEELELRTLCLQMHAAVYVRIGAWEILLGN